MNKKFNWYLLPPILAAFSAILISTITFFFARTTGYLIIMIIAIVAFVIAVAYIPFNMKAWSQMKQSNNEGQEDNDEDDRVGILGGRNWADFTISVIMLIATSLSLIALIKFIFFNL